MKYMLQKNENCNKKNILTFNLIIYAYILHTYKYNSPINWQGIAFSETQKSVGFEAGAGEGRLNELCLGW